MRVYILWLLSIMFLCQPVFANPYWDPQQVPKDNINSYKIHAIDIAKLKPVTNHSAVNVLRIQVEFDNASQAYKISNTVIEPSGTPAFIARSTRKPILGSFVGELKDETGNVFYYDSVGTGKEYLQLARAVNFRFPVPASNMYFTLLAENPTTGAMEVVLSKLIEVKNLTLELTKNYNVDVRELALATKSPSIRVNIYAEGYLASESQTFWEHALKAVQALKTQKFPGVEYMSFYGVYQASNKELGYAQDLGLPIPEYDTFLGLYFPYWDNFGRWYNVVYPTRENKFRQGLASAPYDYPIVLVNDGGYWGVGNYMSHTAIPAANSFYFTYLLTHEFGHFFGLNEEYEGGGRTELEFAPDIQEPWSQNITFLTKPGHKNLKWNSFVSTNTKLPTPGSDWHSSPPVYGAYDGGYADSFSSKGSSHKPGLNCAMDRYKQFCDICARAITEVVKSDAGL